MSSWKPHPALAQPAVLFLLVCLFVFSMRVQFKAVQCYVSVPAPSLCYCPHQSFFTEPLSPPGQFPSRHICTMWKASAFLLFIVVILEEL